MPAENRREATLTFRLADVEKFLSDLTRIEQKLTNIAKLCGVTTSTGGGAAGAIMPAGTPSVTAVIPASGYAAAIGGNATIAATTDPTLPLVAPPQGSPQQQRVGAASVPNGVYNAPVDPNRTVLYTRQQLQDAMTPPAPRTPTEWISQRITQSVQRAPAESDRLLQTVPLLASVARFVANPVVAMAGAGLYMGYTYARNWFEVEAQRAEWAASGAGITPERRRLWEIQRDVGWLPFGIGAWTMRPISARLQFEETVHGTEERIRALGGLVGIEDLLLQPRGVGGGIVSAPGGKEFRPWAREAVQLLNLIMDMVPSLASQPEGPASGIRALLQSDILPIFQRFERLGQEFGKRAIESWGRPEWVMLRQAMGRGGAYSNQYSPLSTVTANVMGMYYAGMGDIQGLSTILPMIGTEAPPPGSGLISQADIMRMALAQEYRIAMGSLYSAQSQYYSAGAQAAQLFGRPGEEVFEFYRRAQMRQGMATAQLRTNLRTLEQLRAGIHDPAYAYAFDLAIAQLGRQAQQSQSEYAQLGRTAGTTLLEYKTGILQAQAQLAEIEGLSPAEATRAQARWYRALLTQPEMFFGPGVTLSPAERAQYTTRARGLEISAIQQQAAYAGGLAGFGQQEALGQLGVMQARGQIWNPAMQKAFENVQVFVQQRIAAIDAMIQEYAAAGLGANSLLMRGAMAQRSSLMASLEQVRVEAFQTKYATLGAPAAAVSTVGGIGASVVSALGGPVANLAVPFALQTQGAQAQLALARQQYSEAVQTWGPNSLQAMAALQMVAQAQAQVQMLPFQQIEARYGLAMRAPSAIAGGLGMAAGIAAIAGGTGAAAPMLIGAATSMQNVAAIASAKAEEIARTPGAGPALIAEAWQGAQAAAAQAAQSWLSTADYTQPPALRETMAQARFAENVLTSTFGARGSVRAMARQRQDAAREMIANLTRYRDTMLPHIPTNLRGAWLHQINEQIRANASEWVAAQQELEQGWLERVISTQWNAPENASLVLNEFSYAGAVMRGGIAARHLGATSQQLDYYRRQPSTFYAYGGAYGGAGKFGTPLGFIESALSGVTDIPSTAMLPGLPLSGGASPVGPSAGLGAPPANNVLRVEIVLVDNNGSMLGTVQRTIDDAQRPINENIIMHTGRGQWN